MRGSATESNKLMLVLRSWEQQFQQPPTRRRSREWRSWPQQWTTFNTFTTWSVTTSQCVSGEEWGPSSSRSPCPRPAPVFHQHPSLWHHPQVRWWQVTSIKDILPTLTWTRTILTTTLHSLPTLPCLPCQDTPVPWPHHSGLPTLTQVTTPVTVQLSLPAPPTRVTCPDVSRPVILATVSAPGLSTVTAGSCLQSQLRWPATPPPSPRTPPPPPPTMMTTIMMNY